MKYFILMTFSLLMATQAFAGFTQVCEGWHQPASSEIQKVTMTYTEQSGTNIKQSVQIAGYDYSADWDLKTSSLNVDIRQGNKILMFSIARPPTLYYNDAFTTITLENDTKLSISCIIVQ